MGEPLMRRILLDQSRPRGAEKKDAAPSFHAALEDALTIPVQDPFRFDFAGQPRTTRRIRCAQVPGGGGARDGMSDVNHPGWQAIERAMGAVLELPEELPRGLPRATAASDSHGGGISAKRLSPLQQFSPGPNSGIADGH